MIKLFFNVKQCLNCNSDLLYKNIDYDGMLVKHYKITSCMNNNCFERYLRFSIKGILNESFYYKSYCCENTHGKSTLYFVMPNSRKQFLIKNFVFNPLIHNISELKILL